MRHFQTFWLDHGCGCSVKVYCRTRRQDDSDGKLHRTDDVASLCVEALSRTSLRFNVCSEVGTPTSNYTKVLDEAQSDGDSCSSA